jgi:hypothetical protein
MVCGCILDRNSHDCPEKKTVYNSKVWLQSLLKVDNRNAWKYELMYLAENDCSSTVLIDCINNW